MNDLPVSPLLIRKYNRPVPRYTSYPTVPFWKEHIGIAQWSTCFSAQFEKHNPENGISIYIHLPFCESLCTYCGCNKKITSNHSVEHDYLIAIEKEWKLYRRLMQQTPVIREIHLGGGTPTFFSPRNLHLLVTGILKDSIIHPQFEFSVEGHPNNTTPQHLGLLYDLGFRRISYGVQDLDPQVQQVINRIQPFENVKRATEDARTTGFTSVNFDLIYGLPLQRLPSIRDTIGKVLELQPDRVAFYSYAHVPWTSKVQRLFNEHDLPPAEEKMQLYLEGRSLFLDHGYHDIGMDHFSLPHDGLHKARERGQLHRNFMGYTTQNSPFLLGLGVSSISDTATAFAQNEKSLHGYYEAVNLGQPAISRGYFLNEEDLAFRKYIRDISCLGATTFNAADLPLLQEYTFPVLDGMAGDGLLEYDHNGLQLTGEGHYFIRNACAAFDLYLQRNKDLPGTAAFSKAV